MGDVLDQSAIDALLAGTVVEATDDVKPEHLVFSRVKRDSDTLEIKQYDFKRPERVSKDQMRALQAVHEGFARNFGVSLSGFLRTIVEVKVASCEQMTYSEFTSGLPNPTSFNLISIEGLEGQLCLEISPLIIFPIIDRLLGGNTQDLFIPQRPLTLIENRLISSVTARGLQALAEAWADVRVLQFRVAATESNPQLVQIVPPNEVVVVIGFEIKLTTRAGTMKLCIPYNVIEPVMAALSSETWFNSMRHQRSKETEDHLRGNLSLAPLSVTGILAETTITVREMLHLQPGDLIVTDKLTSKPVLMCVEGEPKYAAHLGQHRGFRALKVIRPTTPEDRF